MKIEPFEFDGKTTYRLFSDMDELGTVETYHNDFHAQNCYLRFCLKSFDREIAGNLISALGQYIGRPMQVMLSSTDQKLADFLKAGGFQRVRRCFKMEVSAEDLSTKCLMAVPFRKYRKGDLAYNTCCKLLHRIYEENHKLINPLTADSEAFCQRIPETVFCRVSDGQVVHFSFIEENEIAYVGSTDQESFLPFIQSVIAELFARYETIFFECDDTDKTAMVLKSLFIAEESVFYDTYIYEII